MDPFSDATAIVTGGGSGIGLALGTHLARRGARVVLADVDGARAEAAGRSLDDGTGRVSCSRLDVRDAAAVRSLVDDVVARHGRLDLMFNNAGIGVGGNLQELSVDHWDRVIDVNLRGVVNGVMAAYPVMVRQGNGHIVNTASMDGLIPHALLTPYSTTKFAVVGLSLSLRAEAADLGVRVSAVCPGPVDTPLLDSRGPNDLPEPATMIEDTRRYLTRTVRACSPDHAADRILRGVKRNRPIIVVPWWVKPGWALMRLSPRLMIRYTRKDAARTRRDLMADPR